MTSEFPSDNVSAAGIILGSTESWVVLAIHNIPVRKVRRQHAMLQYFTQQMREIRSSDEKEKLLETRSISIVLNQGRMFPEAVCVVPEFSPIVRLDF
ncbi:unnamed protein product, partial [Nesidiocoris tenuis]